MDLSLVNGKYFFGIVSGLGGVILTLLTQYVLACLPKSWRCCHQNLALVKRSSGRISSANENRTICFGHVAFSI
jgi:hypothetical protein